MYKYFLKLVKKLFSSLDINNLSKEKQLLFIQKLNNENLDNFTRSYNQYLCQKSFNPTIYNLLNMISLFTFFPSVIYLLLKRKIVKKSDIKYKTVIRVISKDIIPSSINITNSINSKNDMSLDFQDIFFILRLYKRFFLNAYFLQKNIIKISIISNDISVYENNQFIVNDEFSFSSSLVTEYCNFKGVKYINIMHGDKFFYIRDAYVSFHKFYVWDEHYKNLFNQMYADPTQFIIEKPKLYEIDQSIIEKPIFKYYFDGFEKKDDLLNLLKILKEIDKKYKVILRKHPRYTFKNEINQLISDFIIEDNNSVDIKTSILESKFVCSKYSTVLLEAIFLKKTVVLDDISIDINKLIELDYIVTHKNYKKLSEMI